MKTYLVHCTDTAPNAGTGYPVAQFTTREDADALATRLNNERQYASYYVTERPDGESCPLLARVIAAGLGEQ